MKIQFLPLVPSSSSETRKRYKEVSRVQGILRSHPYGFAMPQSAPEGAPLLSRTDSQDSVVAATTAAVMVATGTAASGAAVTCTGIRVAVVVFALVVVVVALIVVVGLGAAGRIGTAAIAVIVRIVGGLRVVRSVGTIVVGIGAVRDSIAVRVSVLCPRGVEADELAVAAKGIRQHDGR